MTGVPEKMVKLLAKGRPARLVSSKNADDPASRLPAAPWGPVTPDPMAVPARPRPVAAGPEVQTSQRFAPLAAPIDQGGLWFGDGGFARSRSALVMVREAPWNALPWVEIGMAMALVTVLVLA